MRLIDIQLEKDGEKEDFYATFTVADEGDERMMLVYTKLCAFLDELMRELGLNPLTVGADWEDLEKDEVGLELLPSI
jgi:hypothetical protein